MVVIVVLLFVLLPVCGSLFDLSLWGLLVCLLVLCWVALLPGFCDLLFVLYCWFVLRFVWVCVLVFWLFDLFVFICNVSVCLRVLGCCLFCVLVLG